MADDDYGQELIARSHLLFLEQARGPSHILTPEAEELLEEMRAAARDEGDVAAALVQVAGLIMRAMMGSQEALVIALEVSLHADEVEPPEPDADLP